MSDEATKKRRRKAHGRLRKDQTIDSVMVEEPFAFQHPVDNQTSGEGAYVSATLNGRRYFGVIVDQATLKAASLLHLRQEAAGLDLNRRIKSLLPDNQLGQPKRFQNSASYAASPRQVQKFRFVEGTGGQQGYRDLLATYSDAGAAAEDDEKKKELITAACAAGGNFVGAYYYQFVEAASAALISISDRKYHRSINLSMSMSFNSFLEGTAFPPWSPPVNLEVGQQAMLNMLQLKRDKKGNFVPDESSSNAMTLMPASLLGQGIIPMEPRHCFRVGIVGAGIAGLSTCHEIFRQCEREGIDVEIHLFEGRDRLGGRLHTDRTTFKGSDGVTPFPVDLGASWIHGIQSNPLADLAREAGVDFLVTSEDVKMLQGDMEVVDAAKDKHAGELFDKLLDAAAEMTWSPNPVRSTDKQAATVRWYASILDKNQKSGQRPQLLEVPPHRQSADVSVDHAIGRAISERLLTDFESLSIEERRMLFWNMKNVEYALGANLSDLSQMFWDIDERHAFEGDHVVLRQGYSVVVEHLFQQLQQRGQRFHCHLHCPVGKIEYARSSTSQTYIPKTPKRQTLLDLSDTCCISSEDGDTEILCDFAVCAVPLGVLKQSLIQSSSIGDRLMFEPPLPFAKNDSIAAVGFGLLDKVYLQFSAAFWRTDKEGNGETHTLFGNASGVHPHHYMFLDVGRVLDSGDNPPAILMSLVSGIEAVDCEWLSLNDIVREVMETLRNLFASKHVPDPIRVRATKWGTDRFSRGSYTFLGPGTTDADFHVLQSPCNGNGDSILLDGSETMRLFFAGEHTTALHPSMAHGAMLSGIRAGREVFDAINLTVESESIDRLIPLCLYRHMNPKGSLHCALCRGAESATEGLLIAFKRGSRYVCVHNNCAEACPEVEITEGKWENVVKAVNRGLLIDCFFCEQAGATIGCQVPECNKSFHYSCALKTGWDFEAFGKEFECEDHRENADLIRMADGSLQHALLPGPHEDEVRSVDDGSIPASADEIHSGQNPVSVPSSLCSLRLLLKREDQSGRLLTRLVRITRASLDSLWNIDLKLNKDTQGDKYHLTFARSKADRLHDDVLGGEVVNMINGREIGSPELDTLDKVFALLKQEVELLMQVAECIDA